MTELNVNIDHVATIRQARKADYPDPVWAAALAELAGADGITCHLRIDRRHIQERDLRILRQTVRTKLNLEVSTAQDPLGVAMEVGPDIVTLVPERPEELTTEGGLSVTHNRDAITNAVNLLGERDIRISVFIDPSIDQIKAAHEIGIKMIEINTTRYVEAPNADTRRKEYGQVMDAVRLAEKLKMRIAAGHALDYKNVGPIAAIPQVTELNIGHAVIARAVLVGMERAVREMIEAIRLGEPPAA
ncbi:MAG: pyridoxine 5'-phosphate synthase [Deltaproteobacteria bacterium]|nr:pyridoxine 5'-phosphate synthase [Deltaproteobacteria bacterium]